jgi:putative AbiEi antitoxin of type IV toxin-antitoxin system
MLGVSFERLVAGQAGVVSLAQAVAAGMSPDTVQRRVRQGRWTRLHPGIYLVGGHRHTPEARIRAAWLWGGPYSVVTGPAAAFWHRMLDRTPAIVELSVPAQMSPRPQAGIGLRRRDLFDSDVRELDGIRVAAAPFAALETAVALPEGSTFLDRALQKHVRFPAVYRSFCRNMGRNGHPPPAGSSSPPPTGPTPPRSGCWYACSARPASTGGYSGPSRPVQDRPRLPSPARGDRG